LLKLAARLMTEESTGPHCREPQVDCGGCIVLLFKRDAVPGDHRFVESEPRFRTVLLDEFSDRMIVRSLRTLAKSSYSKRRILTAQDQVALGRTWALFYASSCFFPWRRPSNRRGKEHDPTPNLASYGILQE